ncbi:hypothetical protein VTH06DRAFT_4415, partial [Thermothelomyces fergusii]
MRSPRLLLPTFCSLGTLLLLQPPGAHAIFRDEVGHIDYHHQLLGLPQRETTFFHRPRRDDRASLLYTLSDLGVLGAVNPATGEILWRQSLSAGRTRDDDGGGGGGGGGGRPPRGFMRAGEGEGWVASAYGGAVHAWDA